MERPFQKKESELDEPITRLLSDMKQVKTDSEEYSKMLVRLGRLLDDRRKERGERLSMDTLAVVAGNLLGILTIVMYEQKHVMVSKAFGLLNRSKSTTP
jgi:hypothetical protein